MFEKLKKLFDALKKFKELEKCGAVYFIECPGFIKIGQCKLLNLYNRKTELQDGNPFDLKILGIIIYESEMDAKEEGDVLHKQFEPLRERKEWFRVSQVLLDYIAEHTEVPAPYLEKSREYHRLKERLSELKKKVH